MTERVEMIHDWSYCIRFVVVQGHGDGDLLFTGFYERAVFIQVFTQFTKALCLYLFLAL